MRDKPAPSAEEAGAKAPGVMLQVQETQGPKHLRKKGQGVTEGRKDPSCPEPCCQDKQGPGQEGKA